MRGEADAASDSDGTATKSAFGDRKARATPTATHRDTPARNGLRPETLLLVRGEDSMATQHEP
jgi:hypothetical protein